MPTQPVPFQTGPQVRLVRECVSITYAFVYCFARARARPIILTWLSRRLLGNLRQNYRNQKVVVCTTTDSIHTSTRRYCARDSQHFSHITHHHTRADVVVASPDTLLHDKFPCKCVCVCVRCVKPYRCVCVCTSFVTRCTLIGSHMRAVHVSVCVCARLPAVKSFNQFHQHES